MFDYKETMDRILRRKVDEGSVMGASALILHKGKEMYYNAFGYGDAERGIPMGRDTIIRLHSMTKPVTAAAVMALAEQGRLDLMDPVSEYLPCFKGQKVWEEGAGEVPARRDITLFDLMNMTSGIGSIETETEPGRRMKEALEPLRARRNQYDLQAHVRGIASVPLFFQPGDRWMYGYSADVLAAVVEIVSEMSFGEFLKKEFFEPLHMEDTGFFVPGEKLGRFAQYYDLTAEGGLVPHTECIQGGYFGEDVAFESGGAGLVSTLEDYGHFASMMVNRGEYGGRHILGRKTVEFMTKDRLTEKQRRTYTLESVRGYGYGCLMRVLTDQGLAGTNASLGEFGWDGWAGNYVSMDPEENLVILYFIQRCGAGTPDVVRKLRMATYAALGRN